MVISIFFAFGSVDSPWVNSDLRAELMQRPADLYQKSRKWAGDIAKMGKNNTRRGSRKMAWLRGSTPVSEGYDGGLGLPEWDGSLGPLGHGMPWTEIWDSWFLSCGEALKPLMFAFQVNVVLINECLSSGEFECTFIECNRRPQVENESWLHHLPKHVHGYCMADQ